MKRSRKYTLIFSGIVVFGLMQAYIISVSYYYREAYHYGACMDEAPPPVTARHIWTFRTRDFKSLCQVPKGWYITRYNYDQL